MKELTLIETVKAVGEKVGKLKENKAGLESSRDLLLERAKESANEIMRLTNSSTLKDAFSKLYALTQLEVDLEQVMNKINECYDTGNFEHFDEYATRVREIHQKIESIKNKTKSKSDDNPEIEEKEEKVETPKKDDEEVEDNRVHDDEEDEDEEDIPEHKEEPKKPAAKKVVRFVEDDEEDI